MELSKKESEAILTLSKIFEQDNFKEICLHYFLSKGLSKVNEAIQQLPDSLKTELNKAINKC